MNEPLIERDVAYYLEWLRLFRQRIEDDKKDRAVVVRDLGAPLRGHPLPEWLVLMSTLHGVGVLKFKAENPDWLAQYRASRGSTYDPPRGPFVH